MSEVAMRSIVRNGRVLDAKSLPLIDADVLIEGDTIAAVGPRLEAPPDAEPIDANARIVIPGLVNCHTHAHNNVLRGVADNWTLEDARNFGPARASPPAPAAPPVASLAVTAHVVLDRGPWASGRGLRRIDVVGWGSLQHRF
jgi:hypothetical protein